MAKSDRTQRRAGELAYRRRFRNRLRPQLPSHDGWAVSNFIIPFCYVDDLINCLTRLTNEEASGSRAKGVSAHPAYGLLNRIEILVPPLSMGHCQTRE
jgi:hypothetical protein